MEWKTIIISIISSTFVVGLIEFFIKKSYEKLLDKKIEEAKEEIRRKSKVYDVQFETYMLFDGLVYRARNTARDIKNQFEDLTSFDPNIMDELASKLNTYNDTIIELLYEKRAVLNKNIFKDIHELKQMVPILILTANSAARKTKSGTKIDERALQECHNIFKIVDKLYTSINDFIQNEIKVK